MEFFRIIIYSVGAAFISYEFGFFVGTGVGLLGLALFPIWEDK